MTTATAKLVALPKPKRTWCQFRLRTLFLLVAVVAAACGWLAWRIEHKRRERAAVAAIKKSGGIARYGDSTDPREPQGNQPGLEGSFPT